MRHNAISVCSAFEQPNPEDGGSNSGFPARPAAAVGQVLAGPAVSRKYAGKRNSRRSQHGPNPDAIPRRRDGAGMPRPGIPGIDENTVVTIGWGNPVSQRFARLPRAPEMPRHRVRSYTNRRSDWRPSARLKRWKQPNAVGWDRFDCFPARSRRRDA
jgi:hypothetical protein